MAPVTRRLARQIQQDFNSDVAETVTRVVARAAQSERVQAAIVLAADGDAREAARQAELAQVDGRDVLRQRRAGSWGLGLDPGPATGAPGIWICR